MKKHMYKLVIFPLGLIGITAATGGLLRSAAVMADVDDEVTITVSQSCTMTGNVTSAHTKTIANGQYDSTIGETAVNVTCNDNAGFAVYAIGYTDDAYGKNVLTSSTLGSTHDIATGTLTSGANSQWAMKLGPDTAQSPTYPIIIAGSSADTLKAQGDPDFTAFQEVPNDYTKVAYRTAATDVGTNAEGSNFTTTYQAYISPTQAAGTYTGKVKYVLVHPSNAAAPVKPISFNEAFANANKTKLNGYYKMQDASSGICGDVTVGEVGELIDSRDNTVYHVGKLADDNCWLLDNLALDLTNSTVLNAMDVSNTNASNTSLGYLKGTTTGTTSDQYATSAVSDWSTNQTFGSSHSYSDPLVDANYINTANSSDSLSDAARTWKYGVYYNLCAATAGSYCWGSGATPMTAYGGIAEDICPKNWRMPTGGYGGSEGQYVVLFYDAGYDTYATYRSALHLPLSGKFNNGSADNQGEWGVWLSSTRDYAMGFTYNMGIGMADMYNDEGYVNFGTSSNSLGYSLRCVVGS